MSGLFVPPWRPGVADVQFGIKGHAVAAEGELGEFLVIFANNGQGNIWTADGFLAGHVTYHQGDPRARYFSGYGDPRRGARMDHLTLGQEHFQSFFCKSEKEERYFLVAGPMEVSIFEVQGLEKFRRVRGTVEVTRELVERTRHWEATRIQRRQFARPPIIHCAPAEPELNGHVAEREYPGDGAAIEGLAEFRMAHDDESLYVAWDVHYAGPLKNTGEDFQRVFKTGAAVDFMLSTDPSADAKRLKPAAGDLRLVVTVLNGEPTAVLYRPISPRAPKNHAWKTSTPAGGTTAFDQVTILRNVRIAHQEQEDSYCVEAAVSLKELGIEVRNDLHLRFDWGVLSTQDGHHTTARRYWANKMAVGTTDEPTEARLTPGLWGHLIFKTGRDDTTPGPSLDIDTPDDEVLFEEPED